MSDDAITRAIAIYGAVVSTATAVWKVYTDTRDRGQVKVTMMVGRVFSDGPAPPIAVRMTPEGPKRYDLGEKPRLFFTVTNVGRRPITVEKIYGFRSRRLQRRQGVWLTLTNLPRTLQPGEYVTDWLEDPRDILPIRRLYVLDTTGRSWRVPRRALRKIRREVLQPQAEEARSRP